MKKKSRIRKIHSLFFEKKVKKKEKKLKIYYYKFTSLPQAVFISLPYAMLNWSLFVHEFNLYIFYQFSIFFFVFFLFEFFKDFLKIFSYILY